MSEVISLQALQDAGPLLIAVSTLIASVLIFIMLTWPHRIPASVPGPCRNIPYFGGVFEILRQFDVLPGYITELQESYDGKTFAFPMPKFGTLKGSCYCLATTEEVKHVLKDNFDNYEKGETVQSALGEFLGDGIFASDGAVWKFHRKVASRMFTNRLLRESTLVAKKHSLRMLSHFKQRCKHEGKNNTIEIDIQDIFFRLTMDIFTFIAFGEDLDSVTRKEPHEFATAFDTVQYYSEKRFSNPLWKFDRFFKLSQGENKIAQGTAIVDKFAMKVIAGKRRVLKDLDIKARSSNATRTGEEEEAYQLGPDLLSRFLEDAAKKEADEKEAKLLAKKQEKKLEADQSEARISGTDKELRDIVLNFMIAGRDTTACALSWTMYELTKSPEAQEKVRAEFASVMKSDSDITYDNINKMNYCHAVVLEVLRLHPSVPKDIKYAIKDDVLPTGIRIPAGATVIYCPYAMGRNKKIWPNPDKFYPDRFFKEDGSINEPSVYTYPVFNAGPRLCLGKPLAIMEVKLIIGMLLTHFKVELASKHDGGYASTIVLPMKPGLKIKLTPL